MIGGLWNGLSGLNSFDKALSAESNNITNVNTVAFKSDDVKFEDLMYQSGYGKGSAVQTIDKSTTQGALSITSNNFDVAIDGKGYFIVQDRIDNQTFYTRAGNFQMGDDGLLQTASGQKVLGLTPQAFNVVSSDENEQEFTSQYNQFISSKTVSSDDFTKSINTRASNYLSSATSGGISGNGYKSADAKISDIDALISNYNENLSSYSSNANSESVNSVSQISTIDFAANIANLNDENDSISIYLNNSKITQQFDTDIQTTLNNFSDQISNVKGFTSSVDTTTGVFEITSLLPGKSFNISEALINDDSSGINISTSTDAVLGSGQGLVNSSRDALKTALENADAKLIEITNTISLLDENILTVNEIQMQLSNLNLVENSFGNMIIDKGNIYLKDGNNSFLVGKLETVTFKNEQGLTAQGNNLYSSSEESGEAVYAGNMNDIISNSLELSNSSISNSLTSLVIYQKAYEANSKSITTSDEMLSTAIDLIK